MGAGLSELFVTIAQWAVTQGADGRNPAPGLWRGTTKPHGALGPLTVTYNPHPEEIDNLPHRMIRIETEGGWPVAVVSLTGGELMCSPNPGEDEDGLIAHFKAQTP